MNKILSGVIIGFFLAFTLSFLYKTYWLRDYVCSSNSIEKIDTSKSSMASCVYQIKSLHGNYEEKFSSINKRLDDFLVFGGVIITLLLTITVSVYLKTEVEVAKHFKTNFYELEKQIVGIKNKAEESLGTIQAYESLLRNDINIKNNGEDLIQ